MAEAVTRKPYTPEQKAHALWMHERGWQPSEIALDVGANVSTVYAWIKGRDEGKLTDLPTFNPPPLLLAKTNARNGTQPINDTETDNVIEEATPGTAIEPTSNGVVVADGSPVVFTPEVVNIGRLLELEAQVRAAQGERDAAHHALGEAHATITSLEGTIANMGREAEQAHEVAANELLAERAKTRKYKAALALALNGDDDE